MTYKIEMHSHIKGASSDSLIDPNTYMFELTKTGYHGILVTDHYDEEELECKGVESQLDKQKKWLDGYYRMRYEGEKHNIKVYLGCEYSCETVNQVIDSSDVHLSLIGLHENLFLENIIKLHLSLDELKKLSLKYGFLIIQNHPYRYGLDKLDLSEVDGYEIVNTKESNHIIIPDYNERIQKETISYDLINIGGGDCHNLNDIGKCGILTEKLPKDVMELKDILIKKEYQIIGI